MTDPECVFCELVDGQHPEVERVGEGDDWLAFRDKFPVNEGHTIVIPKTHVRRVSEIGITDSDVLEGLSEAHDDVLEKFDPAATTLGVNNGEAAGQTIPHLHWHVIPRYEGDVEDPTGGIRGVIPDEQTY